MSVTGAPGQGADAHRRGDRRRRRRGCFAALGVMTALLERESSGKGQWVQSSLLQSGIALLDFQAARYLMKGEVPPQVGNDHPTSMPTSAYTTADGYINVGGLRRRHVEAPVRGDRPPGPAAKRPNSTAPRSAREEPGRAEPAAQRGL